MTDQTQRDGSKKVKNIAAVLYLLVLVFLVGGSYLNQPKGVDGASQISNNAGLNP